MIEEAEARRLILEAIPQVEGESLALAEANGRHVFGDVLARVAIPNFDNSAMDGYAVRSGDALYGAQLVVVGEQPAGRDLGLALGSGEAIRIFTGAPLPEGADAVVMQEDTERLGDVVRIIEAARPGEFVRTAGSDLCVGQRILAGGDRLNPQRIGLLASQGLAEVVVARVPKVAIVTTGDELVQPGTELAEGELYDSNSKMLAAMVQHLSASIDVRCGHGRDEFGELRGLVEEMLEERDVLIVAGGVSVGDHDLVRPVLEALGFETGFWRVRMKPGKPFMFGRSACGKKLVFGLPGNPVSAFVTFHVLVAPALRKWMGANPAEVQPSSVSGQLGADVRNPGDRPHYLRGVWVAQSARFLPGGLQQSHALSGLAQANALIRMAPGEQLLEGVQVEVFPVA